VFASALLNEVVPSRGNYCFHRRAHVGQEVRLWFDLPKYKGELKEKMPLSNVVGALIKAACIYKY
jgi:hypothetical protein